MWLAITFSGAAALQGAGMLVLGLIVFIFVLRRWFNRAERRTLLPGHDRTKYAGADVFQYQPVFWRLGLVCALAVALMAFNWTTFTPVSSGLVGYTDRLDDIIDVTTPRTIDPPAPLPPPPPPPIEKVEIDDFRADTTTFSSYDLGSHDPITPPAAVRRPAPVAAPPPPPEIADDSPMIFAEEMPVFGDCGDLPTRDARKTCSDQALLNFINRQVRYPAAAQEIGLSGMAVVRFVVEKDGSISNLQVLRDPGAGLGAEAARVVGLITQQGLRWQPGRQNGRPVRVVFNLPIRFELR